MVITLCNGTVTESDPGDTSNPLSYGLLSGVHQTTTDVVTPNFRSRIAKGEIINNPFHSVKKEYEVAINVSEYKRKTSCGCSGTTQKRKSSQNFYGVGSAEESLDDNLALKETIAFREELNQLSTTVGTQALANVVPAEMEGLVDMAEWKKTFRLVRHPLSGIQEYLKKVRRSRRYKRSTARDLGTYVSNEWLRYRYGLTPLALSLQGALNASLAPRMSNRVTARSSQSTSWHTDEYTWNASHLVWNKSIHYTGSVVGHCRAGILYDHDFTKNDLYGLSMHQLPAAIWEVIPFSFIVDWFVNVESFIKAVTPKANVNTLATWTTTEIEETKRFDASYTWNSISCQDEVKSPGGHFQRVVTEKTRTPGVSAQLSSKIKSINFDAPKDWLHLADSISLILSSLKYR
jgi:hypothetical protein